jgi:hypothetical protein
MPETLLGSIIVLNQISYSRKIKLMQADIVENITSSQVNAFAYSTKYLYLSVLKHFYEMNDVVLNWKKISRYLGENERVVAVTQSIFSCP